MTPELLIRFTLDDNDEVVMSVGLHNFSEETGKLEDYVIELVTHTPWLREYFTNIRRNN